MKVFTPENSGSSMPPVMPKEWNTGSALSTLSVGLKSMRAASWRQLARRLSWLSTTPLGSPSEPEVNSTRAGALGSRPLPAQARSEEHTSELQSLMRHTYAIFCLKKKKTTSNHSHLSHPATGCTLDWISILP